jgi:hypothetical protein
LRDPIRRRDPDALCSWGDLCALHKKVPGFV